MRKRVIPLILAIAALTGILNAAHHASKTKVLEGFVALFDGRTMNGWFTEPGGVQEVWKIDEKTGVLSRSLKNGYIWTDKAYGDFILDLEYKLTRRCNSGVFFRTDPKNPVQGGFEIQLFDNASVPGVKPKNSHGALYDAVAPSSNTAGKVGEWDKMRLRVKGDMVRVWINGEMVTEADLSNWKTAEMNPDGTKNKFMTPLKDLPKTGHIGFQDHGHNVSFRNIFLKEL